MINKERESGHGKLERERPMEVCWLGRGEG